MIHQGLIVGVGADLALTWVWAGRRSSSMARTAPIPNIPAIPGMNPGVWIMGGGGAGDGSSGNGGNGSADGQGADGQNGGSDAKGGGKDAGACGPGSGGGCPNPTHGGGGTAAGDPVDPTTGRVYTTAVIDLELPGTIPLVIARSYSSATRDVDLGLGPGWSHSLAWAIEERRRTLRVLQPAAAPTGALRPEPGQGARLPCGWLVRHAWGYTLEADGLLRVFDEPQGERWALSRVLDRHGNLVRLAYEGGRLTHVLDSVGRLLRVRYHRDGHIAAFEVKNASAQGRWTSFRTYAYDERGDLITATDPEALSDYLKQWESDTGRSCNPDDPRWQTNLQDALNSIDSVKSYRGNDKDTLEQACPNCSQTLPRLWNLAGLEPPNQKVPGKATSITRPEKNTTGPDYPSGWKDKADRGQSPTTKGAYKDATGQPVEPGAWNWDGAKWEKI